jgi:integrase
MPNWVKVAIDARTAPAGIAASHVFRPVNRASSVTGERLGEKVVWQMLRQYAAEVRVPGVAPHDLRRTCAKLCRAASGELEQIQLLFGTRIGSDHRTIPRTKQDLANATNDAIKLRVAV